VSSSQNGIRYRRAKPLLRMSLHSSGKLSSDKSTKSSQRIQNTQNVGELSPGRSPLRSLTIANDKLCENSPLKIVQNKQASKLGFLKSSQKHYEQFTDEKENVNINH
jgi:hypothetical protein